MWWSWKSCFRCCFKNEWNNIAFVDDIYPKVKEINSIKVISKIKNIYKLKKKLEVYNYSNRR